MSLFYVFGICYIYTFHTYIFILVLSRTFIFYLSSTLCFRILSLLFMCFHIFSYDIHILCFSDAFHILYFSYDFHIMCFSYAFLFYTLYCSYTFHVLSSCSCNCLYFHRIAVLCFTYHVISFLVSCLQIP